MDAHLTGPPRGPINLLTTLLLVVLTTGLPVGDTATRAAPAVTRVALVYSPDDTRLSEAAAAIGETLDEICSDDCRDNLQVSSHGTDPAAIASAAGTADLVVPIGSETARKVALAAIDTPTLYGFLPQAAWDRLAACCVDTSDRQRAVLIDQPIARQFALLQAVTADARRVAVLLGPASRGREAELRRTADLLGITLEVGEIDGGDDVGATLRRTMPGADALLALPDPSVYNGSTIYAILLSTYGAGIPVIGYSRPMVTAGSTAAVYASTADVGKAIAQRIVTFAETGSLPPTGLIDIFSIAVNDDVARSLRLSVPDRDALRQRLEKAR